MVLLEKTIICGGNDCVKARIAALFVFHATAFLSNIHLKSAGRVANGKSLLSVIGLMLKPGDEVTLMVEGPDAENAINFLSDFLQNVKDE